MSKAKQQQAAREHGIEMLKKYLANGETLYGQTSQYLTGGSYNKGAFECLVISPNGGSIKGFTIVNVSLYVANAIGCRRTKIGAVIMRTWQDVAEQVASALKVDKINFAKL